ncbi:hypothetical protein ELE36_09685 [Pseudolysobacter antarcticus]|uniref:Metallothionein n=1 Tax=Pseudolysobacter antarcticus TaxID=2511995 RepID=A0A411HJM6_9GAMM|nr:hypothetical protein [Pseudolysobacter antarcticus]QBB70614.1 hypothetical protein ELE36_09685 [Pseudolysobacter antarcticus]
MSTVEVMVDEILPAVSLERKTCAHEACTCLAATDKDYCGSYCETAKDQHQAGDGCGCGHPGCAQD